MKKIISLLSVFAMIATMFTTVAFADANNDLYFKKVDTGVANEVKLVLTLKTNQNIVSFGSTIDMANVLNAGATVKSFKKLDDKFTYNVVTASKVITVSYTDTTLANTLSGEYEIGEVIFDVTNLSGKVAFAQKRGITAKNANNESVASAFSSSAYSYEIEKAPVVDEKAATMEEAVAGNEMYGMKTALTKISFKEVANPVVKLAKDGVDSGKTYELPANVKGGTTDIIGIIRYAADVTGEFVLSVFDGETEVVSTSYVAKAE